MPCNAIIGAAREFHADYTRFTRATCVIRPCSIRSWNRAGLGDANGTEARSAHYTILTVCNKRPIHMVTPHTATHDTRRAGRSCAARAARRVERRPRISRYCPSRRSPSPRLPIARDERIRVTHMKHECSTRVAPAADSDARGHEPSAHTHTRSQRSLGWKGRVRAEARVWARARASESACERAPQGAPWHRRCTPRSARTPSSGARSRCRASSPTSAYARVDATMAEQLVSIAT